MVVECGDRPWREPTTTPNLPSFVRAKEELPNDIILSLTSGRVLSKVSIISLKSCNIAIIFDPASPLCHSLAPTDLRGTEYDCYCIPADLYFGYLRHPYLLVITPNSNLNLCPLYMTMIFRVLMGAHTKRSNSKPDLLSHLTPKTRMPTFDPYYM